MRKCRHCRSEIPKAKDCTDPYQKAGFCNRDCQVDHATQKALKALERKKAKDTREARQKAAQERRERQKAKERIKPTSKLKKEAQAAFNAFIRERDKFESCISCDRTFQEIEGNDGWKPGGAWDCGHYLTVGGFIELRFEELNAHRQCKSCNAGSGKYSHVKEAVTKRYREKLMDKIGLDKVEWLEGPHEPKRYRADDFRAIRDKYRQKRRELIKERGDG